MQLKAGAVFRTSQEEGSVLHPIGFCLSLDGYAFPFLSPVSINFRLDDDPHFLES